MCEKFLVLFVVVLSLLPLYQRMMSALSMSRDDVPDASDGDH